jgi:hypothetical protein
MGTAGPQRPDGMPEKFPEYILNKLPKYMPYKMPKYIRKKYHIKYQNIYQI